MRSYPYAARIQDLWRSTVREPATFTLAVAGAICTILMIIRWISVFRGGPYVITTGGEEESLFSIWKSVQGERVYASPLDPPFAATFYNWLFYWANGRFVVLLSPWFGSGLALPSIVRLLTLMLTVASGFFVYAFLAPLSLFRRIAGSLVITLNPLIGFWSVTARPDMDAMLCDLAGLWCVTKAKRSSAGWLIPALAAFYGAWAFKQYFIAGLIASCLYLVISARWKLAFLLGAGAAIAFAVTISFGNAEYRHALLPLQLSSFGFSPLLAITNCLAAAESAPLFAIGLIFVLTSIRKERQNLFAIAGLISIALMLPASAKQLASINYFFESAALFSVAFLLAWPERGVSAAALAQVISPGLKFVILPWLALDVGPLETLTAAQKPQLALLQPTLRELPGPAVVTIRYANLPWFQDDPPYFVFATTYEFDRARGEPFAFGGISGMIHSGQIKILVCPRSDTKTPFDGIVPASLRQIREDSYWSYFDTSASK
jgi:hypothetical protein